MVSLISNEGMELVIYFVNYISYYYHHFLLVCFYFSSIWILYSCIFSYETCISILILLTVLCKYMYVLLIHLVWLLLLSLN
jgi:hypothetical protein